jgi:hypothetical protein
MIDGKAAVMIGISLVGAIAFWAAIYGWGKWLNRPKREAQPGSFGQDARLERIELAIDAVAIEIERIGESQRFTAKLLAERDRLQPGNAHPSTLPPRVITPH